MITLLWDTASAQLNMSTAAKLVLSAAAATFLLALAFRFVKSRVAGKAEQRGTGMEGAWATTSNGTKGTHLGPTVGASDQAPGLRLRQFSHNDGHSGRRDGTIATETYRPCSKGHEWDQRLPTEVGDFGAHQETTQLHDGEEQLVFKEEEGTSQVVLQPQLGATAMLHGRPERSYSGAMQTVYDHTDSGPASSPSEQHKVLVGSSAGGKSQVSSGGQCSTHHKPESITSTHHKLGSCTGTHQERETCTDTHHKPKSCIGTHQEPETTIGTDCEPEIRLIHQKAKSSTGKQQESESMNGTHHKPESSIGTHHKPESRIGTNHTPESSIGTHKVPESSIGTNQKPNPNIGTHQEPEHCTGTHQDPESITGTHHKPETSIGKHQEPESSTDTHQDPESISGTHYKPESTIGQLSTRPGTSQDVNTSQEPMGVEMRQSPDLAREAFTTRKGVQIAKASSGLGLTINQSCEGVNGVCSTFSSISTVEVQESCIKGNPAKDCGSAQKLPHGGLKGKVYDYFVESTSESRNSRPSAAYTPVIPSMAFEEHLNSQTSYNLLQNQAMLDARVEEAETSSIEILPSVGQKGTMESGSPDGNFQAQNPPQAPPKPQMSQKDFIKTGDLEQNMEKEGLGLERGSPSSLVASSRSTLTASSVGQLGPDVTSAPQAKPNPLPTVEPAATLDFFQSAQAISLDLGNAYSALKTAKEHQLTDLKEAVFKFMSDNYLQVLQSPAIYGQLNALERELILERRMKGKRYVTVADVDTQAPDLPSPQNSSRLCYYDDKANSWHTMSCIPPEVVTSGCAMGTMFNYLFMVAGCDGTGPQMKLSNRVFCYNPLTGAWKEICPLNHARPNCKLVALQACLYAIGGEGQHTMERYDPRLDRWTFATPLPNDTFAVAHMATVCEDKIYVTGGTFRYLLLSYNPKDQIWRSSLMSGSRDRTTEMVAAGSFLYRFDLNRSMGISVHRCNVRARLWYECTTRRMPYPASFQCAVLGKSIHCLSRQLHLLFQADDISPRFGEESLECVPAPRGALYPFILVLPEKRSTQPGP